MAENFFETRLEELLTTKAFNELSADEKKYILLFLTEKEYLEYSPLLLNYKEAMLTDYDRLQPSPKVLVTLSRTFRDQYERKPVLKLKYNYRLLAAATLLFGCAIVLLQVNKKQHLTAIKTNKPEPAVHEAIKQVPISAIDIAKNTIVGSEKRTTHFTDQETSNNFCMEVDSLNDIPCLDPRNTMINVPDDGKKENAPGG